MGQHPTLERVKRPFVHIAEKACNEPKVQNAARCSNVCNTVGERTIAIFASSQNPPLDPLAIRQKPELERKRLIET